MNRRLFFKYAIFYMAGSLKWPLFGQKPATVIYKNVPKKPLPPFSSAEEFFYKIYGEYSSVFITKNIKNGNILEVSSWLASDKQTTFSKFVFKNSQAFKKCDSLWRSQIPADLDPVYYTIIDMA